jgi:DNA-binding transcriptional LysR family regulator
VRIDANGLLARTFLLPRLPAFLDDYPGIEVFLSDSDRMVDLVREGIDCVVRVGEPRDSDMIGRRLTMLEEVTVAAPAYLERFGMPESVDVLAERHSGHRMVGFHSSATGALLPLEFMADGVLRKFILPATVTANGADNYIAMARLGLGLVQVPRYRVHDELKAGTMVAVLPDFPPAPSPVSLQYPPNRQLSPRVRVFIDWLVRTFAALPKQNSVPAPTR